VSINNDALATVENKPSFDFGGAFKIQTSRYAATGVWSRVEYRDPKYWWIGTNINYLADNYIDVSPIARTDGFILILPADFLFQDRERARNY
jgi:hypothetical protein